MRQATNKEIDLLLRRMSRRDAANASESEVQIDTEHLDVDELSAYAQNALPAAVRARYTEHLAECSPCRKLVTELSLSLGAATTAAQVNAVPAPSGLKKFLASLFSPMVLRYAVPAFGVLVIMVVGFVVLRQQNKPEYMTQIAQKQGESPAVAPSEMPSATPLPSDGVHDLHRQSETRPQPPAKPAEAAPESKAAAEPSAVAPVAPAQDEKAGVVAEQRVYVEAAPPAPKLAAADSEVQKKKEAEKNQPAAAVGQSAANAQTSSERAQEPVRDNFRRTDDAAAGRARPEANKTSDRSVQSLGTLSSSRSRAQTDKDDSQTRTVSGRKFRKERGIWTDTAYDSSKETTNVARGSEQFRALVADEPAIRTIAEQLDGEVIVVWKGRAYRIR